MAQKIELFLHRRFEKRLARCNASDQKRCIDRLFIFQENPFHPFLNNHSLTGKYSEYRSINITGDLRAHYRMATKKLAVFVALGTHAELYN